MRRHLTAATAAPNHRQATGFRGFPRGEITFGFVAAGAAALCILLTMLFPQLAHAALTRVPESFSPITGAGSGLTIGTPGGIALDETSTNVFLNDGSNKTDILGGEGGAPVGLVAPFTIPGLTFALDINAVAVDNSATSPNKGTVYIVSGTPPKVKKYQRNPATEKYEGAGELSLGTGATNQAGATVDTKGNLWVGDFNSQTVVKFNTAGVLEKTYNLASSAVRPTSVAVDAAGDLFVIRQTVGSVYKYPADALGEISSSNFVQIVSGGATGLAVDPARNGLFIGFVNRVAEYDTTTLAQKPEFGLGTLGATTRLAVNSSTNRVYASDNGAGKKHIVVFGPPVPLAAAVATPASPVSGTKATLNGTVNPEGVEVTSCFFKYGETASYGQTAPCEQSIPTDSANHNVSANILELLPNSTTYHYKLIVTSVNGTAESADQVFVTNDTVVTGAPTAIGTGTATLNGTVFPESEQITNCKFEYGLTTSATFEDKVDCNPAAGSIPPDFAAHTVSASIAKLQPNAAYKFRLTATTVKYGTASGDVLAFRVAGPPQVTEVRALNADQVSVSIEAKVDPRGFQTNYFFEWGPTSAYGNRIPANLSEPSAGGGEQPIPVMATLSGLQPGTTYHYRVVAKSAVGTTASPDHELETLNGCETLGRPGLGLPEGRCFELVSPRDPGPVAVPAQASGEEIDWQSASQPGSLAYVVAVGLPGATRGGQVLYEATRGIGAGGWSSAQVSPPISTRNETNAANSNSSKTLGLSQDLSCGVIESNQPLTSDATTRALIDAGGVNMYRRNPNGSYTAITTVPPENLQAINGFVGGEYQLGGFSQNCSKVVFISRFRYPGVPAEGQKSSEMEQFVYEWDEGAIRGIGFVPGPGGEEVAVPAGAGVFALNASANVSNIVSADGSRVFFSAPRQTSPNPAEIGQLGVFVRENGNVTRDLSLSETATADLGATYQYATKDGSRVFFTANAGLTTERSSVGTDLYEYNLSSDQLTDLSITHDPTGRAEVAGFIGASQDGSHVYFVARGQLVPGKGMTFAENTASKTYSVYGAAGGVVGYVGSITEDDSLVSGVTVSSQSSVRTSRVSPDGRYLLFQSSANVTRYDSGGRLEAYLYDAGATSERTICLSCRQDGKASVTPPLNGPLARRSLGALNPLYNATTLVMRNGRPVVFFTSFDRLAAGGEEGTANLYEWSHDQVFLIASSPRNLNGPEFEGFVEEFVGFVDASADGTDLYLWTPASLNWEDSDGGRNSIYSARIGGGFAPPAGPPSPCLATAGRSCLGPPTSPAEAPSAGSTTFQGPGNAKPKKSEHKKHKRHRKHKKHRKQGQKKHKQGRHTHKHRRAGK